jgi:hypothetical protein
MPGCFAQQKGMNVRMTRHNSSGHFILTGSTGQMFDLGQRYLLYNGKNGRNLFLSQ